MRHFTDEQLYEDSTNRQCRAQSVCCDTDDNNINDSWNGHLSRGKTKEKEIITTATVERQQPQRETKAKLRYTVYK